MHLTQVYGNYFRGHEDILDDLFEKLELAIKTGETKDINDIYSKVRHSNNDTLMMTIVKWLKRLCIL